MGLCLPLESADSHRLQRIAEVKFRHILYKKYKRGVNIVDRIDTALALTSVG